MHIALRIGEFILGLAIAIAVIDAAVRTFVLPRPSGVTVSRLVALAVRVVFDLLAKAAKTYEGRDRIMALYGPVTLLSYSVAWLIGQCIGFALIFHSIGHISWQHAVRTSGSSLLTLGFAVPNSGPYVALTFIEAAIGLVLIALLIAYLPTMYGAFSRREVMVSQLAVKAGTPPTPAELLIRAHRTGFLAELDDVFVGWQQWFAEIEETHTSLSLLNFFRSTNPNRSWLTASGTVMDSAALRASTIDLPWTPEAALCVRAGFVTIRSIADFFQIPYDPDPASDAQIAIAKDEFLAVYDQLAAAGVPLRPDRDQCWIDFAGWRVNYDRAIITLAGLIMAPYAPWISDRSLTRRRHRPPMRIRAARKRRPEIP
jgi:hypothetical protein